MALPLWGELQKSQDDPETIEEAISRIVAEHEASPTSHLGDGESLQAHKSAETIDHPAESVVVDKFATVTPSAGYALTNLDRWAQVGQISYNNLSGVGIYIEEGAYDPSYMFQYAGYRLLTDGLTKNMTLAFDLSFAGYTEGFHGRFGIMDSPTTGFNGVYLDVTDTTSKLVAKSSTQTLQTSDLGISWTDEAVRNVRINYSVTDEAFYLLINGVQVASLGVPTGSFPPAGEFILFRMDTDGYNEYSAYVDNLLYGIF